MRVLVVGHSHAGSINAALALRTDLARMPVATRDFKYVSLKRKPLHGLLRDSQSQLTECASGLIENLTLADALVLSLEGNWHNAYGLVDHPRRFDFFGEADEAPPEKNRQIIPRRLMENIFTRQMESVMKSPDGTLRSSFVEVLTFIREHSSCPAVLVESPPPIPDTSKIAQFRSMAASDKYGVSPFPIRQKLWRLQGLLMKQYCERIQVDWLPVPKEVFGADGALDPRAYEGIQDPTHMGPWYGVFVVRQIDAWLGKLGLEHARAES